MKHLETLVVEYLYKAAANQDAPVQIEPYSGRGMYGDQCLSISGDLVDIDHIIMEAIGSYVNDAKENILQGIDAQCEQDIKDGTEQLDNINNILEPLIHGRKQDTLGRQHIVYFPSQEWTRAFDKYKYSST